MPLHAPFPNAIANMVYFPLFSTEDTGMHSRYLGYSMSIKSTAFLPCLMGFISFAVLIAFYGRIELHGGKDGKETKATGEKASKSENGAKSESKESVAQLAEASSNGKRDEKVDL